MEPENEHFECKGYTSNRYVIFNKKTSLIMEFTATDLGRRPNISRFSRLSMWTLPDGESLPVYLIAEKLIEWCHAKGFYNPASTRGRGIWHDRGRTVFNNGSELMIREADGTENVLKFSDFVDTKYAYIVGSKVDIKLNVTLSDKEGKALVDLCCMPGWSIPDSGLLLAGWIFAAPACGIMPWRSHLYIKGKRGSGKSWVMGKVISQCLSGVSIQEELSTTEAGIRQKLGSDAFPVIYDEFEIQNYPDSMRIQGVLNLARQSSSEDSGNITKGTSDQSSPKSFNINSMFVYSSVSSSLRYDQDRSRTTVLSFEREQDSNFDADGFILACEEMFTDEFRGKFLARVLLMAPIMRQNFFIFREAGKGVFSNSDRAADQIATIMTGLYSLTNDGKVTISKARKIIQDIDWTEQLTDLAEMASEDLLLSTILGFTVQIKVGVERTIGEMLGDLMSGGKEYEDILARHGIKKENSRFVIANKNERLGRLLRGINNQEWTDNWVDSLRNVKGSKAVGPTRFINGIQQRGTSLELPDSVQATLLTDIEDVVEQSRTYSGD